jgi:hypothetical protein
MHRQFCRRQIKGSTKVYTVSFHFSMYDSVSYLRWLCT